MKWDLKEKRCVSKCCKKHGWHALVGDLFEIKSTLSQAGTWATRFWDLVFQLPGRTGIVNWDQHDGLHNQSHPRILEPALGRTAKPQEALGRHLLPTSHYLAKIWPNKKTCTVDCHMCDLCSFYVWKKKKPSKRWHMFVFSNIIPSHQLPRYCSCNCLCVSRRDPCWEAVAHDGCPVHSAWGQWRWNCFVFWLSRVVLVVFVLCIVNISQWHHNTLYMYLKSIYMILYVFWITPVSRISFMVTSMPFFNLWPWVTKAFGILSSDHLVFLQSAFHLLHHILKCPTCEFSGKQRPIVWNSEPHHARVL